MKIILNYDSVPKESNAHSFDNNAFDTLSSVSSSNAPLWSHNFNTKDRSCCNYAGVSNVIVEHKKLSNLK